MTVAMPSPEQLDVQEQVLSLPWGDHLHELVVLDFLDLRVDGHEIVAKNLAQILVLAQHLERLAKASRKRIARPIRVVGALRARLDALPDSEVSASQGRGDRDVRVGVGADDAVFDAA